MTYVRAGFGFNIGQDFAQATGRDGNSNPPGQADQALCRATIGVHGVITGFRVMRLREVYHRPKSALRPPCPFGESMAFT